MDHLGGRRTGRLFWCASVSADWQRPADPVLQYHSGVILHQFTIVILLINIIMYYNIIYMILFYIIDFYFYTFYLYIKEQILKTRKISLLFIYFLFLFNYV